MTKNEIVGRLKDGGLDASSTNRRAAVYVADAIAGRAVPGWFAFRIVCNSEDTERRARAILSRWYDIDVNGNRVWRMRAKNRVPLMAIKRGGPTPPPPTVDMIILPDIAEVVLSSDSSVVQATAREDKFASKFDGRYLSLGFVGVTQTELAASLDPAVTVNGVDVGTKVQYQQMLIDDDIISIFPQLGQYAGWYLQFLATSKMEFSSGMVTFGTSFTVSIDFPGVWYSGEVSWQEEQPLWIEAVDGGLQLSIVSYYNSTTSPDYSIKNTQYSVDGGLNWTSLGFSKDDSNPSNAYWYSEMISLTSVGDKVWLRSENGGKFIIQELTNGRMNTGGCVVSLVKKEYLDTDQLPAYSLYETFTDTVVKGNSMTFGNVTSIGERACYKMFTNPGGGYPDYLENVIPMDKITEIWEFGCANMYTNHNHLLAAADMPELNTVQMGSCASMYSLCTSITKAADMPLVEGGAGKSNALASMYYGCSSLTLEDGGQLTFEFPQLPITFGSTTLTTVSDVVNYLKN